MNSSRSVFVRCWQAKTDGWAAATFHKNCDGKGPTVTLILVNSYIFGGYTNVSWNATGNQCRYVPADKAFIFSLNNSRDAPVKLYQYGDSTPAMYDCFRYGPSFGGGDIRVTSDAVNKSDSYTHCGHTYTAPPGYSRHANCPFFAGSYRFSPTDIEVFYEQLI
ncbi:uncharacterized protein LOC111338009 [Stylophora pistillata]|nr:uncharacterized protein LOC111338009 [Stylophora pistillata]